MSFNEIRISGILWDVKIETNDRQTFGTALLEIHSGTVKLFFNSIRAINQFTSLKAGSEIIVQGSLAIEYGNPQIRVSDAVQIPHGGVRELGLNRMKIPV
jgi:hypothetical protein